MKMQFKKVSTKSLMLYPLVNRAEKLEKLKNSGIQTAQLRIKDLKGENRPIIDETSRAILLASLQFVDAIIFFSDETPLNLIENLIPDILAKGGDYKIYDIVGHEIVIQNGGEVVTVPLTDGFSTTNIVEKIKKN